MTNEDTIPAPPPFVECHCGDLEECLCDGNRDGNDVLLLNEWAEGEWPETC